MIRSILFAVVTALVFAACDARPPEARDTSISSTALASRIGAGSAPLVLDVRSRDEYAKGHIPGAINIPHDELATRMTELEVGPSGEIVVHCQSGKRAGMAETTLREAGFSNVRDLTGHWQGWSSSGLPTE